MTATPAQCSALYQVLRAGIDATGWGSWVTDDKLMPIVTNGADAVVAAAPIPAPANPEPVVAQDTEGEDHA